VWALRLKHEVRILQRQETRETVYNTVVATWTELATVWAEVQDMLPSRAERIADGIDVARRPARVRMRWRDDVTTAMRLEVNGRTLQIVAGPAELGFREGIELIAEELTTSGQEP
jgi:SPP1 family predicted phage head-tail adaptor